MALAFSLLLVMALAFSLLLVVAVPALAAIVAIRARKPSPRRIALDSAAAERVGRLYRQYQLITRAEARSAAGARPAG